MHEPKRGHLPEYCRGRSSCNSDRDVERRDWRALLSLAALFTDVTMGGALEFFSAYAIAYTAAYARVVYSPSFFLRTQLRTRLRTQECIQLHGSATFCIPLKIGAVRSCETCQSGQGVVGFSELPGQEDKAWSGTAAPCEVCKLSSCQQPEQLSVAPLAGGGVIVGGGRQSIWVFPILVPK